MKRFMAILLTIAIMISSVVIVSAEDTVLTLNTAKKVSIIVDKETYDNSVVYTFKPTETAWYWFTSSGQSEYADPFAQVYSDSSCSYESQIAIGEDTMIDGNYDLNFKFSAYLTANTTYYVKACAYVYGGVDADTLEYNLLVTKAMTPTSIEINEPSDKYGYVGNSEFLSCSFMPTNAMTTVTWTTSDSSIATVDETGCVNFKKKGTVTITATGAGFTDSITFEVKDVEGIELYDIDEIGYAGESFYFSYRLNPDKVGTNVTWSFGDDSFFVVDETSSVVGTGYCSGTYASDVTGDTTITVTTENGLTDTVNITIKELVEPEAITIDSSISVGLGDDFSVDYALTPSNSKSYTTWTSSNPSVVDCSWVYPEDKYGEGTAYLKAIGAGTTIITVTTENGKTDTIEVTVEEPEYTEISPVQDKSITFEKASDKFLFKFIPEEDGLYVFEATDDTFNSQAVLLNSVLEPIKDDNDSGLGVSFAVGDYLYKGNAYFLEVSSLESTGTISISVRKTYYPSAIEIDETFLEDVRVGDLVRMMYTLEPANSYVDLMWTSSDPTILDFLSDGIFVAYGEGTATITVEASYYANEYDYRVLTDEVEITITAPDSIVLEENKTTSVTTVEGESVLYKFVPNSTGNYVFFSDCQSDVAAKAIFRDGSMISLEESVKRTTDNNFAIVSQLTKGETYYFEVSSEVAATFNICVKQATEVKSFVFSSGEKIADYVGYEETLKFEFTPIDSYSKITLKSSDESVVEVSEGGYIVFVGIGNATITATAENGVTATIQVEVLAPIDLETSKPVNVEIDPEKGIWINYTVSADGSYLLKTEDFNELYWILWDSEGNWIESVSAKYLAKDWKAGDTFSIQIINSNSEKVSDNLRIDMLGDSDSSNKIDTRDLIILKRSLVSGYNVKCNPEAANVNGDAGLTPFDVIYLARFIANNGKPTLATTYSKSAIH